MVLIYSVRKIAIGHAKRSSGSGGGGCLAGYSGGSRSALRNEGLVGGKRDGDAEAFKKLSAFHGNSFS